MLTKLNNHTITVEGAGVVMNITYPFRPMATTAYEFVWECCNRFNTEAKLNPDDGAPTIYVYGEMYKPSQFMNKLASVAEKIGAIVEMSN